MSTELAKAYVQIIPSADGLKSAIEDILGNELPDEGEKSGESIGSKMVGAIKKALVAAGIGKVIKESILAGGDLQQSIGGIETLFKDNADTVKAYAAEAYKTAGISANSYMEQVTSFSASLLQSLGGDTAAAAEAANQALTDMSDNANKMGTSMEDIQNAYQGFAKQNYTMLDNLKLGYGGTKTEMERLLADAQAITGVEYDINNLSDVYNAIHVIQGGVDDLNGGLGDVSKGLGITGTTAKEAATTLTGSLAAMKAAAENLLGSLSLEGGITTQLQALADTVHTFLIGNLVPMVGNILSHLPELAGFLPELVQGGTDAALSLISGMTEGLSGNVSTFLSQALPLVMEFSAQLRANAGQLVDAGLNLIIELANGLIDSLPTLIRTIPTIVSNIAGIINDNAPKLLMTAGTLILNLAQGLIQSIPVLLEEAPKIIAAIVDTIMAFNWLNLGKNILTGIKDGVKELPAKLKELATNAVNHIKTSFQNGGIGKVVSDVFNAVKSSISNIFNGIKNIASNTWNAIKTAITNPLEAAKNTVKALIDKIKGFFNFTWSLPSLKLPHISISGKFSLSPLSVPKFSISWYKQAMDNPMLLTGATIFGAAGSTLLGGGEAGPEVVSGADTLMSMMRTSLTDGLADDLDEIRDCFDRLFAILSQYFPQFAASKGVYLDGNALVGQLAPAMDRALGQLERQRERGR